jgi:hypothetical protein
MPDDEPLYLDVPPEPDQRVIEIHAWIATHADGSEGIVSADIPMPMGMRHSPLLSSKRTVAEKLEPLARKIRQQAMHQANRVVSMKLITFRRIEE